MSAHTPPAQPLAGLNCPCCGEDAFVREKPWWYEHESERCSDCGCNLTVRIDDSDDDEAPIAYVVSDDSCPEGDP